MVMSLFFVMQWYNDGMKPGFQSLPNVIIIISVVLVSTFILYLPLATDTLRLFGFQDDVGMNYVYQNYDGLYYVVPAVSWYNPKSIEAMRLEFTLPLEYYAAHLPLYPVFIALFALVFGYLNAMLAVNIFFTMVLAVLLYYFVAQLKLTKHPLLLIIVFLFLPRFFIIRSVGAPETLFMSLIVGSIFFFERKQFFLAGILGGLATMTKTPGILLFGAYGLVFLERIIRNKEFSFRWFWIGLIPVGLLAVFTLYKIQYNDFFAYFHTGGVVPMPYPFSVFNFNGRWVDTPWLEEIVLYFFIYLSAIVILKDSKYRSLFYFPLLFFLFAVFVQHRDLSRYLLPLWPFALIAFEKYLTSRKFLLVLLLLIPAIYMYAWNFLLYNVIPVADWRPFL